MAKGKKGWDERERQERRSGRILNLVSEGATDARLMAGEVERLRRQLLEMTPPRPPRAPEGKHRHGEALMLMEYVCVGRRDYGVPRLPGRPPFTSASCGHRETFWNSRDGVTPFTSGCPSCGGDLQHRDWARDEYAPDHVPHFGQGVWRDGTADEARQIMEKRFDACKGTEHEVTEEYRREMLERLAEDPASMGFQPGWPMLDRHGYGVGL